VIMAWKSDTQVGEPSPVAVGDDVTFTGANFGATRVSHGLTAFTWNSEAQYNLAENKARTIADAKVYKGSEVRSAYVGRRIKIIGEPQRPLSVDFSFSNSALAQVTGAGTARSTTLVSVLRDGTGVPEASSPKVIDYSYPIDLTPGTLGTEDESFSNRQRLTIFSDEINDGDILRIGVGASSGISSYLSARLTADICNNDNYAYEGLIEYSSIQLTWD
jgi:hypothetical protein